MIIMGTRPRYKVVGKGQFFCPHCQRERNYERKAGKQYFTLYFVPLFPVGGSNEFIECTHCGMSYNADVLDFRPVRSTPDTAQLLNTIKSRLDKGYPIEYVISDLTSEGLDRDIAVNMVKIAGGEIRRSCPKCDLTYAGSVELCSDCKLPLVEKET